MKKLFLGMVLGIFFLLMGAYFFVISGLLPMATKGPPLPLEKWVTRLALKAAMRGEIDTQSPFAANSENLLSGAKIYKQNCAGCHGIRDQKTTSIAQGLFPKPPQFFEKEKGVTEDPPGEIYWFVKNGVRLTGMPGFVDLLTDKELWQVSLFLKNADQLPGNVKSELIQKSE